jgi:hypothetical protein
MAAHSGLKLETAQTDLAEKDGERLRAEGLGRPLRSTAPLLHFYGHYCGRFEGIFGLRTDQLFAILKNVTATPLL